jgi:hypothetical protein
MIEVWKNERPAWCPHLDCQFRLKAQDAMCAGHLPAPAEHDGDFNTGRLCLNGAADNGGVFDLQVNKSDLYHFRRLFKALEAAPPPAEGGTSPSSNPEVAAGPGRAEG